MSEACFTAADILLPAAGIPLDPWACIAVDQFSDRTTRVVRQTDILSAVTPRFVLHRLGQNLFDILCSQGFKQVNAGAGKERRVQQTTGFPWLRR